MWGIKFFKRDENHYNISLTRESGTKGCKLINNWDCRNEIKVNIWDLFMRTSNAIFMLWYKLVGKLWFNKSVIGWVRFRDCTKMDLQGRKYKI